MTETVKEAIDNLSRENMYENGDARQGISIKFLARITMAKLAVGLIKENDPFVIDAKKILEDSYVNYVGMDEDKLAELANTDPKIWGTALEQSLRRYMTLGHIVDNKNLQPFFTRWFDAVIKQTTKHNKENENTIEDSPDDNNWHPARHVSAERSNNAIRVVSAEIFAHRPSNTLLVDLQYPPMDDKFKGGEDRLKYVEVNLTAVRSADGVRLSYDFYRDGWKIEQATIFEWEDDDEICDEGWVEVAFVQAWGSEIKKNETSED